MSIEELMKKPIPKYSKGEELFNWISHLVGALTFFASLVVFIILSILNQYNGLVIASLIFYSLCMLLMFTNSTIYHGIKPTRALKRVARVIDHNTIYFAIAGTYAPVCAIGLTSIFPGNLIIFIVEIVGLIVGSILNIVDINHKFIKYFSIALYVIMGWAVVLYYPAMLSLPLDSFIYLLSGGIAYTLGVIFYAVGKKKKWMHSVFHLFVLLGAVLQLISVLSLILF